MKRMEEGRGEEEGGDRTKERRKVRGQERERNVEKEGGQTRNEEERKKGEDKKEGGGLACIEKRGKRIEVNWS